MIDVEGAVRRLLNDRALYLSLLGQFDAGLPADLSQIRSRIQTQSIADAKRLIHSMCGAAKMLGAERLAVVTAAGYRTLDSEDPASIAQLMRDLEACIASTRTQIHKETARRTG